MIERYSFVALTSKNLEAAKAFWAGLLGLVIVEERPGTYVIVDAGGLRLCIDQEDGDVHRLGGTDPTVGLKVSSASAAGRELLRRGLREEPKVIATAKGSYAIIHDPEGRSVILTEHD